MLYFAFQETNFLTIRRSIFIVSFILSIILFYEISVQIPLTEITNPDGTKQREAIDFITSSVALATYLGYLLWRSKSHGEKYLLDLAKDLNDNLSGTLSSISEGKKLIDNLKSINDVPLYELIPNEEDMKSFKLQLITLYNQEDLNNSLMKAEDQLAEFGNLNKQFMEMLLINNDISEIHSRSEEYDIEKYLHVSNDDMAAYLWKTQQKYNSLFKISNGTRSSLDESYNSINKAIMGIENLAVNIEKRTSSNYINEWLNSMERLLSNLQSNGELLQSRLKMDAFYWDVRLPQVLATLLIIITLGNTIYSCTLQSSC